MNCFTIRNTIILCIFLTTAFCCEIKYGYNIDGLNRSFVDCSHMTREALRNELLHFSNYRLVIHHVNITHLKYELFPDTRSINQMVNLTINNCNVSTIEKKSFNNLNSLKSLYITDNNIKQLNDEFLTPLRYLIHLDLSNNNIQNFSLTYNSRSLKVLKLNNNNFTFLIQNNFYINCQYLVTLKIQNSRIKHIEPGILNNLPKLLVLDLSNNNLQNLEPQIFFGLSQLKTLNLQNSSIKEIKPNAFFGLKEVRNIDLKQNNISDIVKDTLNGLTNLQILDLSFNNIILNRHVFDNTSNITTLILNKNTISELPCELFNNVNKLDSLDLSNNEINEISICAFESLNQLSHLNLHQNNLSFLQIGTFSALHNLKFLDLSNNKISYLEETVIQPLEKLEILNISANQFRNIDLVPLLGHLRSLQQIDLSGNIWNCYDLSSARKYLKSRNITYKSKILNYKEKNIGGIQCYTNLENNDLKNDTLPSTSLHSEKIDEKYYQQITELQKINEKYFQQIVVELQKLPKAIPLNKTTINEINSEKLQEYRQHEDIQYQKDVISELRKGNEKIESFYYIFIVILIICICVISSFYIFKFYKSIKTKDKIFDRESDIALLNNIPMNDSLENYA